MFSSLVSVPCRVCLGVFWSSRVQTVLWVSRREWNWMLKWLNAKCQLSNEKLSEAVRSSPDQMLPVLIKTPIVGVPQTESITLSKKVKLSGSEKHFFIRPVTSLHFTEYVYVFKQFAEVALCECERTLLKLLPYPEHRTIFHSSSESKAGSQLDTSNPSWLIYLICGQWETFIKNSFLTDLQHVWLTMTAFQHLLCQEHTQLSSSSCSFNKEVIR